MTRLSILVLFFGIVLFQEVYSQEFNVLSFSFDQGDISAIRFPRTDLNNQGAAIIKVRTNLTGLSFSCNIGFVGDPDIREGEIWLYVSPREKRLKFMKPGFITHDYVIPEVVKSGSVYLLDLTSKMPVAPDAGSHLGFILLKSVPPEAEVWLDGENTFRYTPFSRALTPGDHTVIVKKEFYHDWTGRIQVFADSTSRETIELIPDFGSLTLRSTPESGAVVMLDGRMLDDRTPLYLPKLATGEHTLVLKRELFRDASKTIRVFSGDSVTLTIPMEPSYGELVMDLPVGSRLVIDKVEIYDWKQPVRLSAGEHLVEVQKNRHQPFARTVVITIGEQIPLKAELVPITGKISVETNPPEARVYIENSYKGLTPLFTEPLLIGSYSVRVEKEGYQAAIQTAEVMEGKTIPLNVSLELQTPSSRGIPVSSSENVQRESTSARKKNPEPTSSNSSSTAKSKKPKDPNDFNLVINLSYVIPSSAFWKADYNDLIESFGYGLGVGLDLRFIYANRFLGTTLCGSAHFFSSKKPESTTYVYQDALLLKTYAGWVEQLFYYLPNRGKFFSYLGGGIGYMDGSYGRYIESEIEKLSEGSLLLLARYGWGFKLSPSVMVELAFQYNFLFSSPGNERRYGLVNLGIVF